MISSLGAAYGFADHGRRSLFLTSTPKHCHRVDAPLLK
ncbi:hypothetical protein AWB69_02035 [Caballeronia udeis]|uniref:Uncharacterized protein n=1 Tax=Caballeronia udeis TaxID=1232866 RepID=A0A158G4D8_9BURK|nr:hypothetical protein AWB69_02035 [Caballeronia udeis]